MKVKNDEVSFLRGHVAQLTQSISQLCLEARGRGDQEKRMVAVLEEGLNE